jgi:succinoglycan biosynthesis transport protein ExoP
MPAELSPYVIRRIGPDSSAPILLPAMPPPVVNEGIGLSDCWQIIRRHSRLIVGLLAAALLTTGIVVFLITPSFTASSTLLIEPEPPQVLDIKELINEEDSTADYDYYKTQFALLKSRDLVASVIRDLDLMHNPLFAPGTGSVGPWHYAITEIGLLLPSSSAAKPHDAPNGASAKAIAAYLSRLTVKPKIGTRLVVISFRAPDPVLAQRIVQAHVRHYIHRDLELRNESRRSAVEFLQKQLVEMKERVQTSEAALHAYRRKNGILSFNVANRNKVAQKRMDNLSKALTGVETKRIAAQAQVQLVRAGNYESLPQVIANPVITALKPRVQQLQAQYADLSAAFNPQYPKLVELKAELSMARKGLQNEIQQVANAVEREYKADTDEENQLRNEISAEKERDFALNDASLQDAVLAREVETNRQLYKNVLLRMQQIAVGQRAPVSNISIVDRAVAPPLPSNPKKRRDLAISGLLALLCGIALAFILDQLDGRLKTSEEVEKYLQLPNLAVAPDFAKVCRLNDRPRRLSPTHRLLPARILRSDQDARAIHHAAASGDVYRSIRTALLFSRGDPPPRKVLITSGLEGEGKTWTAVHTALAFAQSGAKTLLLDADLRRSRCHEAL